ncbi:metallophosphoesterase family protein [Crateriforma conspicua]|uniref:Serine/threonine-protein phosphatase 1 n=1 Tax=Crateriforma conspicua TaxID=2527996 RepID=A0A5C5XWQ4_9PLAN|nr:metallophosphoesterase family protein [Crateriforma conspicua]QDV63420.1 Serine/threonine-protein phosphatase 1 [Crateriforma conspicua]TWT67807.1 Serine/threonine-protein phosphatase 1 [Crateriforma conspicua]
MSGRLIAIGDIHGCTVALENLLRHVQPDPDDLVVALGDYVDRGPDSRGVIDRLIQLGGQTQLVCLMGNHEEMMLEVVRGEAPHHEWLKHGGIETLDSYGFDGDLNFLPPEHQNFLDNLGDFFETDAFFFTHAAYDAGLPLEQQPVDLLRWHSLMRGVPPQHYSGKTAIVGHTANRDGEVVDLGHLICLDTYAYGGQWLTAMDLNERSFWQANQQGQVRVSQ